VREKQAVGHGSSLMPGARREPNRGDPERRESELAVYAIVRAGGRQEKVSVGDVVVIDKVQAQAGDSIDLPALLLVDGATVTTDAAKLAKVKVSAEVVGAHKGPKITIMKFKNKTGYRKRQGHRQHETRVKVTAIEA
jgi:large subunit ribosomal protein L21